ncbi:ABC transporter ATP-binding protein [Aureimonas jatrophae]|jgi:NitT/TauT family transport system ATP-binding protein|uniref:NitT/TauT family transport system ATP-binding protein n=1 Tax=Aureimonas jatrophae TaxID=1166073 RepID=A0A1H0FCB2_9HYPH|nr:ABC transporter ATP-binding protein [Aureimonas jatrophae]MBB3950086.1 NitT/TauT family transport system ATP-binding protein [Aureimonas jatrophae]SDN92142.1 NitT/TauT family transport system ATP-binding protein [Aureimonas jatrophae]
MDRIDVSDLRKTFQLKPGQSVTVDGRRSDRVDVLGGVDLAIRKGEFITLVGPSGSGKSVLLDVIAGLTEASSGVARIDGRAVTRPHAGTAYVFQQYALFPWRTAIENIEYAMEVRGLGRVARRDRARELLDLFGLGGFEDRYPSQLSGGMQQRVAIARALANDPEVLLMDEPFAALDAQTRDLLQAELLRIWETIKTTVVFVTHSIDEAIFLADRIVVMTARPARVKEIIEIDLPRPRAIEIRNGDAFNGYRARVWDALRDEVRKAQGDWSLAARLAH